MVTFRTLTIEGREFAFAKDEDGFVEIKERDAFGAWGYFDVESEPDIAFTIIDSYHDQYLIPLSTFTIPASAVIWATTDAEARLDYRCDKDGCERRANTVHFHPWVTNATQALLACPGHSPGGYWLHLDRWLMPDGRLKQHVAQKNGGGSAVALWNARVDAYRRAKARLS